MTYEQVKTMMDEIGLPNAYYQFEDGSDVNPPFICFYYPNSDNFAADNRVYARIDALTIELYTDNKDFDLEKQVEDVLDAHEIYYDKDETFIESEAMHVVIYEMEVTING